MFNGFSDFLTTFAIRTGKQDETKNRGRDQIKGKFKVIKLQSSISAYLPTIKHLKIETGFKVIFGPKTDYWRENPSDVVCRGV